MDTSVEAVHNAILESLQGAGDIGLHIDDLTTMLGFEEKKQILPRMYSLQGKGLVERMEGQKWRRVSCEKELREGADSDGMVPAMSSTSGVDAFSTPQEHKTFISYKNLMQEYCQKKHHPVPSYRSEKTDFGYLGIITFGPAFMKSQKAMPSLKEAEQRVAYEALKNEQVLPSDADFNKPAQLNLPTQKRPTANLIESTGPPNKVQSLKQQDSPSPKNMLQEVAQKRKLKLPEYKVLANGNDFLAILEFQGRKFTSTKPFGTKKAAEQNAAQVALYELGLISYLPGSGLGDSSMAGFGSTNGVVQRQVNAQLNVRPKSQPNENYKSMLQEYIQKKKVAMPSYRTRPESDLAGFISTVSVEGNEYQSGIKQTKKEAEKDAARIAMISLRLL